MKCVGSCRKQCDYRVTLRARVWVEIHMTDGRTGRLSSPSVRGCGLKCRELVIESRLVCVTLRARVWVEICFSASSLAAVRVTLRARVWVEMIDRMTLSTGNLKFTLRARVWVEMGIRFDYAGYPSSPSVRGCGLKSYSWSKKMGSSKVTLRARVWVEIEQRR